MLKELKTFKAPVTEYNHLFFTLKHYDQVMLLTNKTQKNTVAIFHGYDDGVIDDSIYYQLLELSIMFTNIEFLCCFPNKFIEIHPEFKDYVKIKSECRLVIKAENLRNFENDCIVTISEDIL